MFIRVDSQISISFPFADMIVLIVVGGMRSHGHIIVYWTCYKSSNIKDVVLVKSFTFV